MPKIKIDCGANTTFFIDTPDGFEPLVAQLVSDGFKASEIKIDTASLASWQVAARKQLMRASIEENAGDTLSLLGTTTNVAHLAFMHLARFATAVAAAKTLDDVKNAAQPFTTLCADFLANVESGEVKLPAFEGGEAAAVLEIGARATAVAAAMSEFPASASEAKA